MAAALWLACASTIRAATPVRVGLHDAKPVAFRAADGSASGFLVDVLDHIAEREEWQIEYVYGSWAECLDRLASGEIDLLFPMLITPERRQVFDFTREEMFASWGRVFARADARIDSILDLDGKVIAVVTGDMFNHDIRDLIRQFGLRCEFLELETKTEVLESVARGRADAAAIEGKAGYWHAMGFDINARL